MNSVDPHESLLMDARTKLGFCGVHNTFPMHNQIPKLISDSRLDFTYLKK